MPRWIIRPEDLIEPVPAPEYFVGTVGAIERLGSLMRVYYCCEQMLIESPHTKPMKIVNLKIVRPSEDIARSVELLTPYFAALRGIDRDNDVGETFPRLVT